ncbi:hypothetical protein Salat_1875400 [Sesamum alatum]|uniref:Uncharacterized protein n=1 Tax=Sesamum alatum TaxID=300844 RepID=A0AAE2CI15_9LAMI|nr:hypothetical protein Salat_1875400 [Sesamum alatum]
MAAVRLWFLSSRWVAVSSGGPLITPRWWSNCLSVRGPTPHQAVRHEPRGAYFSVFCVFGRAASLLLPQREGGWAGGCVVAEAGGARSGSGAVGGYGMRIRTLTGCVWLVDCSPPGFHADSDTHMHVCTGHDQPGESSHHMGCGCEHRFRLGDKGYLNTGNPRGRPDRYLHPARDLRGGNCFRCILRARARGLGGPRGRAAHLEVSEGFVQRTRVDSGSGSDNSLMAPARMGPRDPMKPIEVYRHVVVGDQGIEDSTKCVPSTFTG